MLKKLYNKDQIVSVSVHGEELCDFISYKEARRGLLGFNSKPEGFYNSFDVLLETIPFSMVKKAKELYYKPRIEIKYSNNEVERIYFSSSNERDSFVIKNFYEKHWRTSVKI